MKIRIDTDRLMDLLEEEFGNIYANLKEDDTISEVRLVGYTQVEITIGEEVKDNG